MMNTKNPSWVSFNIPRKILDVEELLRNLAPSKFPVEETLRVMKDSVPGDVFYIPNIGFLVLVNNLPEES